MKNIIEVLRSTYITVHGGDCAHLYYDHAIEMAIKALEKQIPKEPIQKEFKSYNGECFNFYYTCPTCGKKVEVDDNEVYATEYYPSCECGQRIKWDDILNEFEMKWL